MGSSCGAPQRVFGFTRAEDDVEAFAAQMGCLSEVATSGCRFQRPLEAALKALSPEARTPWVAEGYVAPTFEAGSGHGDYGGANEGFLRQGSVLAIVVLTNEDDCSAASHELFYDSAYGGSAASPLGLRCSRFPDALRSVGRYVDGLTQLREHPRALVFGAIVGVPQDLAGSGLATYEAMLREPRMEVVELDDAGPAGLAPSCGADDAPRSARPPRRLVELRLGPGRARGLHHGAVNL